MTQLLTAEQLAERWQVSVEQIYALSRKGTIPALKLGRYYRFKIEAIERFENGEDVTQMPRDATEKDATTP
jgi:excisionase family DNA binding protein